MSYSRHTPTELSLQYQIYNASAITIAISHETANYNSLNNQNITWKINQKTERDTYTCKSCKEGSVS